MGIVLGINASFTSNHHDPSASLIVDGNIVFACEEERFNRVKTSIGWFPYRSIDKILQKSGIDISDIDLVASPNIKSKGDLDIRIRNAFEHYFNYAPEIKLYLHPLCHIAGAFYPSGFKKSLGLSIDGAGDGISVLIADCQRGKNFKILESYPFDNSIGDLYALVTERLGFHRTEGEFKVMGMAAYGDKNKYDFSKLIEFDNDSYSINKNIYSSIGSKSCFEVFYNQDFINSLGIPKRSFNENINSNHFDLASSIQNLYEIVLYKLIKKYNHYENLSFSGGCALNCLANGLLLNHFNNSYIMPAASDRGLSLGAACLGCNDLGEDVKPIKTMLLGLDYSQDEIRNTLELCGIKYEEVDPYYEASNLIMEGKVIGWFEGRSEYGPRALGSRSVLANSQLKGVKNLINSKIKFREEYRPFAPAIIDNSLNIDLNKDMFNYMNLAPKIESEFLIKQLGESLHKDSTARIQRVTRESSPDLYSLMERLKKYDCHSVINTSFNLNGEPIVEDPKDAIRTFYSSALDALILGNFKVTKA